MLFKPVRPESPVPIWEQVVDQVTFAIAAGDLEPAALLPSVRELAPQMYVHPNTVAKAWQELERRGLVTARRGRGMEVTPEAPALARQRRREIIQVRLSEVFREALASHLSLAEVRQLVQAELDRANGQHQERVKEGG